jgi:hypothetical protein
MTLLLRRKRSLTRFYYHNDTTGFGAARLGPNANLNANDSHSHFGAKKKPKRE